MRQKLVASVVALLLVGSLGVVGFGFVFTEDVQGVEVNDFSVSDVELETEDGNVTEVTAEPNMNVEWEGTGVEAVQFSYFINDGTGDVFFETQEVNVGGQNEVDRQLDEFATHSEAEDTLDPSTFNVEKGEVTKHDVNFRVVITLLDSNGQEITSTEVDDDFTFKVDASGGAETTVERGDQSVAANGGDTVAVTVRVNEEVEDIDVLDEFSPSASNVEVSSADPFPAIQSPRDDNSAILFVWENVEPSEPVEVTYRVTLPDDADGTFEITPSDDSFKGETVNMEVVETDDSSGSDGGDDGSSDSGDESGSEDSGDGDSSNDGSGGGGGDDSGDNNDFDVQISVVEGEVDIDAE